jgi:LPXTG-motif cell wall-anchored protein
MNGDEPGCEAPKTEECPDGDYNGMKDGCEPPKTEECPDGDMNGEAEGCAPPVDEDEILGVEKERTGPPAFVEMERPARAPAEVAPSAGFLPETGAGQFGLAMTAGLVLLAAGGAVLALRRPQAKR